MTEKETDLPKEAVRAWELATNQRSPVATSSAPGPPGAQEGPPRRPSVHAPLWGEQDMGPRVGSGCPGTRQNQPLGTKGAPFQLRFGKCRSMSGSPRLLNSSSRRNGWTLTQHGVLRAAKTSLTCPHPPKRRDGLQVPG